MKALFGKLFLTFTAIITLIIIALMVSFLLIYSNSFEERVIEENNKQAMHIAGSLYSFMHNAYKMVEELSFNSDVLSMDTERQTRVFETTIERNDYFELLYAQGMDGMQTGRSSGTLGNRKERWWFIQMEQTGKPFISESYYSVGTNMPCASVFYPMIAGNQMIGIMAGDIKLSSLHDLVVEFTDADNGSWAFILDGKGIVVAHPDKTYQEELYNYVTLTKTVTVKDEAGVPIQDAAGNITEEQVFEISDAYKAAIADMMQGNISSAVFEEEGQAIYLSYRPVEMDGHSDPWYVLSVRDGDVAMQTRDTVILLVTVSSVIIIVTALLIVLLTVRSISSRVKIEAMEANMKYEKAQASERAKSEFLAMMSHEIRTPMNAILGVTELQMQKEDMPKEYAEAFDTIFSSSHNLLGIINDILDMSKIETGKLELHPVQYDIPSLINDTIQVNTVRIGSKPIEFALEVDENLPSVMFGDELRIKQILSNLLSNAVKYTEAGMVKLSIRNEESEIPNCVHLKTSDCHCGLDPQSPEINMGFRVGAHSDKYIEGHNYDKTNNEVYLIFTVSDTGQGMKPEDVKKLFTEYLRFNTEANRTTEGTGLGLSITKKLAEMMDGEISVQSEYGKGSVFTVKIKQKIINSEPIGEQVVASLCGFTYVDRKVRDRRKTNRYPMPYGKVLIVDDVESNLYVAKGLLAQYKLQTETVTSGFAAIEKVEAGNTYDIILMDHMMPKMDGIETTQRLRWHGYKGYIVALTANALAGNEAMFMSNGFDGFIPKPIDIRMLDMILNKFIRKTHPQEAAKAEAEAESMVEVENSDAGENENSKQDGAGDEKETRQDAGLQYGGGNRKIDDTLRRIFIKETKKAIDTLRETAASSDIKLFTTTAHAMKSALANIGEQEASDAALSLEKAGLGKDTGYISANTDKFIEMLEDIMGKLGNTETGSGTAEDVQLLVQQLEKIITACDDYDETDAITAINILLDKNRAWKKETAAALEGIHDALYLDSDFEKAAGLAQKLRGKYDGSL